MKACIQMTSVASLWMNDTNRSPGILITFVLTLKSVVVGLPFLVLSRLKQGSSLERENFCFLAVNANQKQHGKNNQ